MRIYGCIVVASCIAGCGTNVGGSGGGGGGSGTSAGRPANTQSAREICIGPDDASDMYLTMGFFVDGWVELAQEAAASGLTRVEQTRGWLDVCQSEEFIESFSEALSEEVSEASSEEVRDALVGWCARCSMAITDEVYDNYVPDNSARGICLRAGFLDDQISGMISLAREARDEGFSQREYANITWSYGVCENRCADYSGQSATECEVGCQGCNIAIRAEVW